MGGNFYDNRELSWLKFNERVLEEAFVKETPLFERLRFVQIFCSNLDEFFMIRVGSLTDKKMFAPKERENKTNMTAAEQLTQIAARVKKLIPMKDEAYTEIMNGLSAYGVEHIREGELSPEEESFLKAYFTREIRLYDHDVDFRDIMSKLVKKRKKLQPVRLEFQGSPSSEAVSILSKTLDIGKEFIFTQNMPLATGFMSVIERRLETMQPKPAELFFEPLTPQRSPLIAPDRSIIEQVKQRDILLSYPYENINQFIKLLEEAADNPEVVSIKITLYRVARDSKIINALIRAAENGKDVLALVELRARFDEENNIGWSKQLEEAGVTVIYGLDELKVHSKLLLITLRRGNDVSYITQVGTGNYNERTSRLYTDLTLMTADRDFGSDASVVFNALAVGATTESTNKLLVAPKGLKSRIVELIDNEITYGSSGYIGIKMNSLTDRDIIEKLAEASRAGVRVELVVRGICCLIAGVKGETDNIRVISIVGRFLEHSRIYIFGREDRRRVYISSADFMTRNTERRVEVAAPVLDTALADRVVWIFNTMLRDNVKAREQGSDGLYLHIKRADGEKPLNSQLYFYEQAYAAAANAENQRPAERPRSMKVKLRRIKG